MLVLSRNEAPAVDSSEAVACVLKRFFGGRS